MLILPGLFSFYFELCSWRGRDLVDSFLLDGVILIQLDGVTSLKTSWLVNMWWGAPWPPSVLECILPASAQLTHGWQFWLSQPSIVALWHMSNPSGADKLYNLAHQTSYHWVGDKHPAVEAMWCGQQSMSYFLPWYHDNMPWASGKDAHISPCELADVLTIRDFYHTLTTSWACANLFGLPHNPGGGIVKRGFGWTSPPIRVILLLFTQPRWSLPTEKILPPAWV